MILILSCTVIPDYRVEYALHLYNMKGKHYQAIEEIKKEISQNPYNARAYFKLGYFYLGLGDFEKAEGALKKAVELYEEKNTPFKFTKYHASVDNLALINLALGNFEKAIQLAKEASMPGYDNNQPLFTLFQAQILNGNLGEGLENFKRYKLFDFTVNDKSKSYLIEFVMKKELTVYNYLLYVKASLTDENPQKALNYLKNVLKELPENEELIQLKETYEDPEYLNKQFKRKQNKK